MSKRKREHINLGRAEIGMEESDFGAAEKMLDLFYLTASQV